MAILYTYTSREKNITYYKMAYYDDWKELEHKLEVYLEKHKFICRGKEQPL